MIFDHYAERRKNRRKPTIELFWHKADDTKSENIVTRNCLWNDWLPIWILYTLRWSPPPTPNKQVNNGMGTEFPNWQHSCKQKACHGMCVCQGMYIKIGYKVWGKKKCTRVCVYYKNYARFRQKSIKSAKSTHPENSKLVRQVHVVQKVPPGSMIEQKNGFCENTIFVKNYLQKKVHLHLWISCKIC